LRHGGDGVRVDFNAVEAAQAHRVGRERSADAVLALDEALRQFATDWPRHARLVELRFFAGLTLDDAAMTQGISRATAVRQWGFARAWLLAAMGTERAEVFGAARAACDERGS
jgi:hypothetical protein